MSLENFLILGAILFSIGLYGALSKRNAIAVLMSIELMFNAVNITAVALSRYVVPASLLGDSASITDQAARTLLTGQIFSIFIITVAAAEIALGVAIVIALYRSRETVFVTDATQLKN
ncbi:MAG: NADH-quinone oxidoreductase subunit NuoK [Chloroflexota bacterium]|nr:NADH-quinone oxidoreductase subunit NuoK [Chloroflexota bacterium]MYD50226.1 NADH-quinone oxidoreductase subunit NuoK [Dehalococcoidia bacterium]